MEVFLVRHTPTALASGTCYGHSDVALSSSAVQDIARTLEQLPRIDVIYSSPAQRCIRMAATLAGRDGCVPVLSPELRELNFGAWEGQLWNEISREQSDYWASDPWNRAPPDGETECALWQRVATWYSQSLHSVQGRRIAVIAHGGPLRVLRCLLMGLPPADRWAWTPVPGAVAVFAPNSLCRS